MASDYAGVNHCGNDFIRWGRIGAEWGGTAQNSVSRMKETEME